MWPHVLPFVLAAGAVITWRLFDMTSSLANLQNAVAALKARLAVDDSADLDALTAEIDAMAVPLDAPAGPTASPTFSTATQTVSTDVPLSGTTVTTV